MYIYTCLHRFSIGSGRLYAYNTRHKLLEVCNRLMVDFVAIFVSALYGRTDLMLNRHILVRIVMEWDLQMFLRVMDVKAHIGKAEDTLYILCIYTIYNLIFKEK